MKFLIDFFAHRHLLANVLFWGMLFLGVFTWFGIGKEEMPEFESNWIRVTTGYPGAPAEDVELFVTKPMEDELKGVVGIEEIVTTSSLGISSIRITLDDDFPDKKEVVQEIQDAVLRVKLPSEVRDIPRIRQFKSSEKAILDIGIYHEGKKTLDSEARAKLQQFALSFENQITTIKEVSSITRSYYLKPELQIEVDPKKILRSEISLAQIRTQIMANNIRVPIGSLEDKGESKVSAMNELEDVDSLKNLMLQSNYQGHGVRLGDITHEIKNGFQKSTTIFKINGHEGIFLNVRKSISTDILAAQKAVGDFIKRFKASNKDAPIGIVLMDDESYDVKNRLRIISSNGLLGFFLIVLVLLFFLDGKTGFWVAMGIPFSMAFTLIIAAVVGYTVNNMTLAGIIIVLGIVVDDAIIIAENISRKMEEGLDPLMASKVGTYEVFRPIIASILTTCVAFIPLAFFEGFFGKLVKYIPLIVILMLCGSLIESLLILPSHISGKNFLLDRFSRKRNEKHWFSRFENKYKGILLKAFDFRIVILVFFIFLLAGAGLLFGKKMKFVMFPREESKEVFIKFKAEKGKTRYETSKLIFPLEEMLFKDTKNVVGVRTTIGKSRRGGEVKQNQGSVLVELIPADERDESLNTILDRWEKVGKELPGMEFVKFLRGRWGHSSGNAIELQIQENDDVKRDKVAKILESKMKEMKELSDVEIDEPMVKKEFVLDLLQSEMMRFGVSPANITNTLRSFIEGSILYSINKGEEEVDVRLTVPEKEKTSLEELLKLRVENREGQLIYLKNVVKIKEVNRPIYITRRDYKRVTMVYASMAEGVKTTPLTIAEKLESEVFPEIIGQFPNTILSFKGEIEDTRESQGEFRNSIIIVVVMIYLILVVMFNSLTKPLFVLSAVPFGMSGVIYILYLHGMSIYGFFAVIGALGMIGVVVNDAIVMIDKIEKTGMRSWESIAQVASTRLRPVLLTTITTVVGVLPTAYGLAGYDSMLAEMMLTMGWGLAFGTVITLFLVPMLYTFYPQKRPQVSESIN